MENLKQINYVLFGENILPDLATKMGIDSITPLHIKFSTITKQDFSLDLHYLNIHNIENSILNTMLDEFDFNLAIFVCNLLDKEGIDKLKNFKFELPEDPDQKKKKFEDLKDYIKEKKLFPVVIGYLNDYTKKAILKEDDVKSFAQELKASSLFPEALKESYLYADDPYVAIIEITRDYLSEKFNKKVSFITSPEKDIKCTFIIIDDKRLENMKKRGFICLPY